MADLGFPNPLTDDHCDKLCRILESCAHTGKLIECLQDVGLDVSRGKEENDSQRDLATRLKAKFFPDSP